MKFVVFNHFNCTLFFSALIRNYENNKIKFDYKLRKGKSTTQNAVYLMRLAGIEIKAH